MSLRLVRKLFPSLSIAPERLRSGSRAESSRAMRRGVFASRYDAPLRILILFFRPLYETRRESSRTARSSRVPRFPSALLVSREKSRRPRGGGSVEKFSRRSNAPSSEVDARASRARREESSAFVRSFEMASRARDLERALAEPWPSHRCATALDEEVVNALKQRFSIMTPFSRRGALYAALLASKTTHAEALAAIAREDSDEWARATARVMDEGGGRFSCERLLTNVPTVRARETRANDAGRGAFSFASRGCPANPNASNARDERVADGCARDSTFLSQVNDALRSIRETIASVDEVRVKPPRADAYLTPVSQPPATTSKHFTLRERRTPKKKPTTTARGVLSKTDAATASRTQTSGTSSIFAPSRKPTSAGASFLRDTGRAGSVSARARASGLGGAAAARGGSKTMVIDVAEAAQLGASQNADPLRAQAQEERERKRQREKEAKEQRIQRLMEEREARKKEELTRKRQRDEEILEKKKAYRAEIEAKRAKQRATTAKESNPATPSPVEEPAMWPN